MPDRNEELVCEEKMDRIAEELEELMLDALLKGRFRTWRGPQRKIIFPAEISGSKIYFPTSLFISTILHAYVKSQNLFAVSCKKVTF
jgi:hypothetical protein